MVGAKVCELTDGFLWFVCGLYVGILTSPLREHVSLIMFSQTLMVNLLLQTNMSPSEYSPMFNSV